MELERNNVIIESESTFREEEEERMQVK